MYELILQLVLMTSLAVVVYLMALAVPRVEEGDDKKEGNGLANLNLAKLDGILNSFKGKLIRRLKIVVMKTDNMLSKQLNNKEEKL